MHLNISKFLHILQPLSNRRRSCKHSWLSSQGRLTVHVD